jgi:hypothetical protein
LFYTHDLLSCTTSYASSTDHIIMLGLVRLSPTLIRPLARKPHTINLVIKHKSRFSTHTPVCHPYFLCFSIILTSPKGNSLFPLGTYSSIVKPVLFTIGVIGGSLCLAGNYSPFLLPSSSIHLPHPHPHFPFSSNVSLLSIISLIFSLLFSFSLSFSFSPLSLFLFILEYAVKKRRYWKDITDSIKKALNTYQWVPPHTGTAYVLVLSLLYSNILIMN